MFNSYTEEFRRNAVAVVRSGYGLTSLAKRLSIPPTTIRNWLGDPRYSDVAPAGNDLISKLPPEQASGESLVLIGENSAVVNKCCLPDLKIRIGNAVIEIPKNISAEAFRLLIQALRDSHVL